MKNILFKPIIIILMVGISFLGAISALKLGGVISQSPWAIYILLTFDVFFLFTYRTIKNNPQVVTTHRLDYKILLVFVGAYLAGFGAILIALTISGIVFILVNLN